MLRNAVRSGVAARIQIASIIERRRDPMLRAAYALAKRLEATKEEGSIACADCRGCGAQTLRPCGGSREGVGITFCVRGWCPECYVWREQCWLCTAECKGDYFGGTDDDGDFGGASQESESTGSEGTSPSIKMALDEKYRAEECYGSVSERRPHPTQQSTPYPKAMAGCGHVLNQFEMLVGEYKCYACTGTSSSKLLRLERTKVPFHVSCYMEFTSWLETRRNIRCVFCMWLWWASFVRRERRMERVLFLVRSWEREHFHVRYRCRQVLIAWRLECSPPLVDSSTDDDRPVWQHIDSTSDSDSDEVGRPRDLFATL